MKRKIYQIFFVLLVLMTMTRCTEPMIEVYEPIDLSPYDAEATYFNYGGYTHFILTFNNSSPVVLDLCTDQLSATVEQLVQTGSYSFSDSFEDHVLGMFSEINNQPVTSGSVTIEKDFLTYFVTATLNGSNAGYEGYIFTLTDVSMKMSVSGRTLGSDVIKLTNAAGDTLAIPYTDSYLGTFVLDETATYTAAGGTTKGVVEGTVTISGGNGVYSVTGSVLVDDPTVITVSGGWSNVTNGTVTYSSYVYGNTYWTAVFTDTSGFSFTAVVATDGSSFFSEGGNNYTVKNDFSANSLVAYYDWGAYGSGGTTYTVDGVTYYITSGSLTLSSSDGEKIGVEGSLSDGTNTFAVSGTYVVPVQLKLFAVSDWTAYGGSYTLKFLTDDDALTATYNSSTWSYNYTGSGEYLSMDFLQAVTGGTTYTAAANGEATASNFVIGYYNSTYYSWFGTMYGVITDGTLAQEPVVEGSASVIENTGVYTINFILKAQSGAALFAQYSGDLVPE